MMKINGDYYSNISMELQRYEEIADYYRNNPSRLKPNRTYLKIIENRLVEISFLDEEVPRELQIRSDKLLELLVKITKN